MALRVWWRQRAAEGRAEETAAQCAVPWAMRTSGASFAQTCFFGRTRSSVVFLRMSAGSQTQGGERSNSHIEQLPE